MAIVKNFWLRNQSKKLGGAVIYQAMGQTRSRALASEVTNPRTTSQMNQRVRWSNCVNIYRVNSSWMRFAYETKKRNQTDYNKFMSLNVATSRIFLTKNMASAGAAVAAPYIMTQGTLPSVTTSQIEGSLITNIYVSAADLDFSSMTVGTFASNLLANNPGLRANDQLSIILNIQQFNPDTGFPFVLLRKFEVLLDTTSVSPLSDYMPVSYFSSIQQADLVNLIVSPRDMSGTICLVLSRTSGGKTYVSTQTSITIRNEAVIAQYSSEAARQAAIDSYGTETDIFLTTTSAGVAPSVNLPNSISELRVNAGDRTYVYRPGSNFPIGALEDLAQTTVLFENALTEGDEIEVHIETSLGQNITATGTRVGANVNYNFPTGTTFRPNEAIKSIVVLIDNVAYEISFIVYNSQTIGGLE